MTQAEKIRIIADAMEGKCKVEVSMGNEWLSVEIGENGDWKIGNNFGSFVDELFWYRIRIAKTLPLLSDADAEFAEKYLPHDWWIVRDNTKSLYVYNKKPYRHERGYWVGRDFISLINSKLNFPKFESIKWENEDCYTIQELLNHYKESKK